MRDLGNFCKESNLEQMVMLASMIHQVNVTYRDGPVTFADMDWSDRAEAYENCYVEDPSMASLWYQPSDDRKDLSDFWDTLETFKKDPPIRAINQLKAIDHMNDQINFLEEYREYPQARSRWEFLSKVVQNTKVNLRREMQISKTWY